VSDEAIDLLKILLTKNPTKRPSATECLQHPWIMGRDVDSLDCDPAINKFTPDIMQRVDTSLNFAAENLSKRMKLKQEGNLC
jgi:serine/threonine protein kinase